MEIFYDSDDGHKRSYKRIHISRRAESRSSRVTKKQIILLGLCLFVLGVGVALSYLRAGNNRELTFEECEKAGGTTWRVDLYHPDICPACAEYQACEEKNRGVSDIRQACPQVIPCTECLEQNSPYPDRCPDRLEKIGQISDAAIWFQCCR